MNLKTDFGTADLSIPVTDAQGIATREWARFFSLVQELGIPISFAPTVYTASGTWRQPADKPVRFLLAVAIGGGGGGAGWSTGTGLPGGGGGSGAIAVKLIDVRRLRQAVVTGAWVGITITIGALGAGGAPGTAGTNGTAGGATILTWTDEDGGAYTVTIPGGMGGVARGLSLGRNTGRGGAGGSLPVGADLNLCGLPGETYNGDAVPYVAPGGGGFGGATATDILSWPCAGNSASANTGGGGGAGGTYNAEVPNSGRGGDGASGIVVLWELA
jgi:hypothetical protein